MKLLRFKQNLVLLLLLSAINGFAILDEDLLNEIKNAEAEILYNVEKIVNIDSPADHPEGINALQKILGEKLRTLGGEIHTLTSPAGAEHITATFSGAGKKNILMMAHLDTVYKIGTAKESPFRIEGRQAYGPGVIDDKSSIIAGVYALKILKRLGKNDYAKISFIINADEEIGSPFSKDIITILAKTHHYAICIEGGWSEDGIVFFRHALGKRPSFPKNAGTEMLIKKAREIYSEIGKKLIVYGGGGGSDANFTVDAGIPTIDAVGFTGGNSHTPDEYMNIDSIVPRLYLLTRLIIELGSGR
jgi:acetylornithine deacetylase/succinyl-diaminopimelate desuccinylase-like protein